MLQWIKGTGVGPGRGCRANLTLAEKILGLLVRRKDLPIG